MLWQLQRKGSLILIIPKFSKTNIHASLHSRHSKTYLPIDICERLICLAWSSQWDRRNIIKKKKLFQISKVPFSSNVSLFRFQYIEKIVNLPEINEKRNYEIADLRMIKWFLKNYHYQQMCFWSRVDKIDKEILMMLLESILGNYKYREV